MTRVLAKMFWSVLAVLFLIEAWLWDHIGAALTRFAAALPIEPLRAALRALVARLPPMAVLFIFALPLLFIEPLKFLALALIAKGRLFSAAAVFLVAKTAGVGIAAFLFDSCRERLLEMDWFARLYVAVLRARDWAHARVDPYRRRIKQVVADLRARTRALMARSAGEGALVRKFLALRETMRRRIAQR